ncbi:MAG: DnaJ family domain-containing protein [Burkholderiales bacterium]
MLLLDLIAEQKIAEAMAHGEFDDLPTQGRPLELEDDTLVPEDLRMAYRILRNAGFVPPEVQALQEIGQLERLIARLEEGEQRAVALKKLDLLRLRLSERRRSARNLELEEAYYRKLLDRLA